MIRTSCSGRATHLFVGVMVVLITAAVAVPRGDSLAAHRRTGWEQLAIGIFLTLVPPTVVIPDVAHRGSLGLRTRSGR